MQIPALERFSEGCWHSVLAGSMKDRRSDRSEYPVRVPTDRLPGIEESLILAMYPLDFIKALAEEPGEYSHKRRENEKAAHKVKTYTILVPFDTGAYYNVPRTGFATCTTRRRSTGVRHPYFDGKRRAVKSVPSARSAGRNADSVHGDRAVGDEQSDSAPGEPGFRTVFDRENRASRAGRNVVALHGHRQGNEFVGAPREVRGSEHRALVVADTENLELSVAAQPCGIEPAQPGNARRQPGVSAEVDGHAGVYPVVRPLPSSLDDQAFTLVSGNTDPGRVSCKGVSRIHPRTPPEIALLVRGRRTKSGAPFQPMRSSRILPLASGPTDSTERPTSAIGWDAQSGRIQESSPD